MSLCKRCNGPTMLTEPATLHRDYRSCYEYVVKENAMLSLQLAERSARGKDTTEVGVYETWDSRGHAVIFTDPPRIPSWKEVHRALGEP